MSNSKPLLNVRINNEMKKELKLISVYEDTTVTDVVTGFIEYGIRIYHEEKRLIKDK